MTHTEKKLIVACARTELTPGKKAEINEFAGRISDWQKVISLSSAHRLLPLVYHNLKQACPDLVPQETLYSLKKAYKDNAIRNLSNATALLKMLDLLKANDIQAVPFKGPLIAERAYNDLNLRSFSDLDILIRQSDVPKAKKVLSQTGYEAEIEISGKHQQKFIQHENSISFFHKNHLPVDLHWEITGRYLLKPIYLEFFSEKLATKSFLGKQIFSIPEDVMLVYLCVHGASHCWDRLEWLCCFVELMKRQTEQTILDALGLAKHIGAKRIFLLGLFLGKYLLAAKYPDALEQGLTYDRGIVQRGHKISNEMFDRPAHFDSGAAWRFSPMHIMIRDSCLDRLKYAFYLFTLPTIKEWSKYPAPYMLTSFYRVIRPFRLAWTFIALRIK